MAAPQIAIQFFNRLDYLCPDGVEMYVANQVKQIIFLVAEDGLVSILEEMTCPVMTTIEVQCVPREGASA